MSKCIRCGKDTDETTLCGDIDSFPYAQGETRAPYCKSCKSKDDLTVTLGCLVIVVVILLLILLPVLCT